MTLKYTYFSVLVIYSPAVKALYWGIATLSILREEILPESTLRSN